MRGTYLHYRFFVKTETIFWILQGNTIVRVGLFIKSHMGKELKQLLNFVFFQSFIGQGY